MPDSLFQPIEPGLFTPVDASSPTPRSAETHRAEGAEVATAETTASTSYTDLATGGPEVTLGVGPSGRVLVVLSCIAGNATAGSRGHMGFAISGANTLAASDGFSIRSPTASDVGAGTSVLVTDLNAGTSTFTAKYRATADTASFSNRRLQVIPL